MKELAMNSRKPTRADEVRRRRSQESKTRRATASQSAAVIRPLVSRPRVTGAPGRTRPKSGQGRRFELLLARTNPLVLLPTLPRVRGSWRMVSVSIVLLFAAMLGRLMVDQRMYVKELNLGGAALVPAEEIYKQSGLARQHIFWVSPADVERRLKAVSGIASAQVSVQWPNVVTVLVTEKVPVIKLLEGEQEWWVNAAGERFTVRGDVPGLLPIEVDDVQSLGGDAVPFAAIQGALQLRELRPNIERLHYDTQHGLSYQDGRDWRGYFGVGTDMAQKLAVYETLVDNLMARGIHPAWLSVEDARAPYYLK
jgi:cell division septal protein FtsQ